MISPSADGRRIGGFNRVTHHHEWLERSTSGLPSCPLVEDDHAFARYLEIALEEVGDLGIGVEMETAETLAQALKMLGEVPFDVVLLDLALPDSTGVATFERMREHDVDVPIVILASSADDRVALRAAEVGIEEFMSKDELDPRVLIRRMRVALVRHDQRLDMREKLSKLAQELELRQLELTSEELKVPLRVREPEMWMQLQGSVGALVVRAVERRSRPETHLLEAASREIGTQLGAVRARARDVIELHTTVVRSLIDASTPHRGEAIFDEGRIVVLALLGHLADYYLMANATENEGV